MASGKVTLHPYLTEFVDQDSGGRQEGPKVFAMHQEHAEVQVERAIRGMQLPPTTKVLGRFGGEEPHTGGYRL